jgi:endonuclease YncB( thermonuclease family)
MVALVRKQGGLLNSELVRNGLAWVYPRYCHAQPLCTELELLERGARRQRLGLWREKAPMEKGAAMKKYL